MKPVASNRVAVPLNGAILVHDERRARNPHSLIAELPWFAESALGPTLIEAEATARAIVVMPEVHTLLRDCFGYLDWIPESAAGGDDEAVALARRTKAVLDKLEGRA
jgi:hypothetical protein